MPACRCKACVCSAWPRCCATHGWNRAAQVVQCLDVINDALRHVRQDPDALICAVDRDGRCFASEVTSHSVLTLWQGIVASRALQMPAKPESTSPAPAAVG